MNYEEADNLLKEYLKDKMHVYNHCVTVANFVYEVSLKIDKLHPELNIDSERMKVIGLLHDIGRGLKKSHTYHMFTGAEILRERGFSKIAKIIETHGIAKELAEKKCKEGDFEPKTIEEELLTYADAHVMWDKVVDFKKRIADLMERAKATPDRYDALKKAAPRLNKIIEKIDKLLDKSKTN